MLCVYIYICIKSDVITAVMFTIMIGTCRFLKTLKYLNISDNFNILTYVFFFMKEEVLLFIYLFI